MRRFSILLKNRKRELDEELQSHLKMAIQDRIDRGESPDQARASAMREFGNMALVEDVTRGMWGWIRLEKLAQDLKYAVRQLRKSPGFAVTAILTLALGIGANVAVFSLIYTIMLRNLPVPHPEQIVQLEMQNEGKPSPYQMTSMYNVVAANQTPLAGMCGWLGDELLITSLGDPKRVGTANVTGDCFSTLQVTALLGRLITPADDLPGGGPQGFATVLSYDYWNTTFHHDPNVLGKTLLFDNVFSLKTAGVIVGVLPKNFGGLLVGATQSLYLPSYFEGKDNRDSNGNISMLVFGRLKPGVTRAQAELQLRPAFAAWRAAMPPNSRDDLKTDLKHNALGVYNANTGYSGLAEVFGNALRFLQVLVSLILIAGCAYLSTLFSVRMMSRRKELALRFALGASRSRIALQLMTESILLVAIGAAGGLFIAWGAARLLLSYITVSADTPPPDLQPDAVLLAFAAVVSCLAVLMTGLLPAIRGSKANVISDIKESRSSFGGRRAWRLGSVLMPLQIAFSVVVVLIATLLSASLVRALTQNNGFRLSGTLFIETTMPGVLTEKTDKQENKIKAELAVYHAINERLNHAPGIVSGSIGQVHPLGMANYIGAFKTMGSKDIRSDREITENWVAPRYFETVGTQLLRGRDFSHSDSHDSQEVCILSAAAARNFFPDGNSIGRSLVPYWEERGGKPASPITVIGVVEDTRWNSLRDTMPRMIYIPLDQETGFLQSMKIVVRTNDDAVATSAVRNILREEAGAQVTDIVSISDAVNGSLGQSRLLATLSNMLAGLALLLSAIAIYGLLSYSVKQCTSEIAVRMAVGATRADVIRMFVRQASALVLPGVLLGVVAAFGVARLMSSLLYQTSPADPWGFCLGVGTLMTVGLIASYFPAHRASRVEPMQALRSE